MAGKTIEVFPYINAHEEGIEGNSSVKDFETFLQMMYLYYTQPRKDEALLNLILQKTRSVLQFVKQDPQTWFSGYP